jgi:hypothetical protein
VFYIAGMIGLPRRRHRGAFPAGALFAALALLFGGVGCGSSGDSTGGETTAQPGGPGPSGQAGPGATARRSGEGAKAGARAKAAGGSTRSQATSERRRGSVKASDRSARKVRRHIAAVVAAHCPKGTDVSQCEALVEASEQASSSPSYTVTQPEDCLKAMSQQECEATYSAQKQAAESGGTSVDVQACLEDPTPRCEAIVRPFLEQQRAAEEASK